MSRNHNFSAGPGTLPLAVLEEAQEEFNRMPGLEAGPDLSEKQIYELV